MLSEIGSNFWLNPDQQYNDKQIGTPSQFKCEGEDYVWLSTGRSAIAYAIHTIERRNQHIKKVAVLPSFTCDTVFEPFLKAGYDVHYYPVGKNLRTTSDSILETVLKHDASIVLYHRYFGFNTLDEQVDRMCDILHGLGKYTIEDCTQCLYSNFDRSKADYIVGSIRKWTGTPDGGFIVSRSGSFDDKPQESDKILENAKVIASFAKYRYLIENKGKKSDMLSMYRKAEDILDEQSGFYTIAPMSAKVQASLDTNDLSNKRRDNFNILRLALKGRFYPLFELDGYKTVPLYFPILVEDRASLQKHLVQNAVYAPVVWPKDDKQPKQCEGAENAYEHLLCIPIDQRYDADDMNRIVEVINGFYNE